METNIQISSLSSDLISYTGDFTSQLTYDITNQAEKKLLEFENKKNVIKRVCYILIEGIQNIRKHGVININGYQNSFIKVSKTQNYYKILMGNLIYNNYINNLSNKISTINSLSHEQMKTQYFETLNNGKISKKGGAGLGFITMAMRTKNNIGFQFNKIDDDLTFFTVEITLNR